MDSLLIVVAINALMLGVAFIFGGFATIVGPSTAETEELRQAIEAARSRSWFHAQAEALRQAAGKGWLALSFHCTLARKTAGPEIDLLWRHMFCL